MTDPRDKADQLLEKLEILLKKQEEFSKEIRSLQTEINQLRSPGDGPAPAPASVPRPSPTPGISAGPQAGKQPAGRLLAVPPIRRKGSIPGIKTDLERFVGENLINKIGIIITVIGVAIGAKYAIDNELISPLTRIILGYLSGIALLGFAIRLKKKYENFSAVLLSGSMAILYFITYAAYDFYNLVPQAAAFALMVIFTVFTVVAALHYNRQVIAHIGLVGAYAVPFLLSNDSGNAVTLFSYVALINAGILAVSFKRYWKSVYYSSFALTWLIWFSWYLSAYESKKHFTLALAFLSLFFILFYLTFLAYKLLRKEQFGKQDIFLLLANSFIYYGAAYVVLSEHNTGSQLLGLFTLANAIIHAVVSAVIFRRKLADRHLFYLVSGLVLVFIAIAIPVQLNGSWVTLLWAGQAALLFWIGRTRNVPVYEKLSYPLMLLAFFSIGHDWASTYPGYLYHPEKPETRITPFLNIRLLSSLLFASAFGFMTVLNRNPAYPSPFAPGKAWQKIAGFLIPAIFLFTLYNAFRLEITGYWDQLYADSVVETDSSYQRWNYDLKRFGSVWVINYTLLFLSALAFVNIRKLKDRLLGNLNLILLVIALLAFLSQGLYELSELRESYLDKELNAYYPKSAFHIGVRYISFCFAALALAACYRYSREDFIQMKFRTVFDFVLHISVLWISSSELINWMDIAESAQSYKLGLSILWGAYSLFLIALGIYGKKKHLRIGAIALFGVTLVKLFFYDISHLNTIAKTIVLVSLGVLLLVISFLYNKYKHIISDEPEN